MDEVTLDDFMNRLGETSSEDKTSAATGMMRLAEAVAKRAKKDYGLGVDDAQYVLKDFVCDVDKKGAPDAEGQDRFVQSYISTIAKDRDSEAILPEGFVLDDYKTLPIVLFSHDYGALGMGKNQWIKPNTKAAPELMHSLLAKTIFAPEKANPLAEQVYQWSIGDFPIGDSVGFIPVESVKPDDKSWGKIYDSWVKRTTAFLKAKGREATADLLEGLERIYTKVILLEYSKVMIPSNPFAVSVAVEKGLLLPSEADKYTIPDPDDADDEIPITTTDTDPDAILVRNYVEDDVELKEGRTLSAKTLKQMATTVEGMNQSIEVTTAARDSLLILMGITEEEEVEDEVEPEKGLVDEVVEVEVEEKTPEKVTLDEILQYAAETQADEEQSEIDKALEAFAVEWTYSHGKAG